ncbi:mediator of DNA damage checkpoint protein 1 [Dermacentor silvarum]|uniref:mediator of DNA damage checkpoint protein 1 n=1 Tax=Dermacentor silvarum TaxID=543639 RepID=UPI002101312F|nr:mediator of DNA damage checkpoint protein 1 [Dermacentor silvarum]
MDGNDLEMTQVIHGQDDSEDEAEREIRAILKLHDQDAPAAFQSFHLKPGTNVVGRSRTCDVIIENYAVSKQHAIIDVGSDSCTIMDLGSQNKVKIGKRTLKPNCQYNLDYNEEFCIAGLRARILYDQNNGAKSDTGSDTCSESLLTAIEVSKDQEGVDAEACDNADKPEPSAAAAGLDEETGAAVESKLEVSNKTASKSSQNAKTCNSEYQSSGSFTMPEMPMLDYTQTDSSQGTEPYAGADRDAQTNQEGAGAGAPAAQVPVGANAPAAKDTDAFLCAPTQPYSDATCGGNAGDTFKPATADQESRLNAETQPYTDNAERPEVPSSNPGEIIDLEMDETDRLNAPTQAYENDPSAEAERLNAPTQAYTEQDEDERLNAVTQPYAPDINQEEEERLNAVTQPYAGDVNQEEEERLNAVTQPYATDVNQEEERLNAATQPYAADVNQEEQDRLNAVTQSFNDNAEEDNMVEESVCAPTQPEERHRRLLCGPSELSFVLCEASQPCRDDGGDDDEEEEEFCAPTQKDESPPLKVHALLKYRRERGTVAAEDDNDKTPPLSPKTTIDETPPPSPGFVPESDPEDDDGDTSMVTARRSSSIFNMTGASVYEDCVTPGGAIGGSPIIGSIGKVSGKRPRRGMSLKKPTCDTVLELPSQESTAGAEWMQQQQAASHSKASKKLTYIEEADDSRDLSAKTSDASLAELSVSGDEHTSKNSSIITTCSPQKVPAEPQESADTNKNRVTTEDGEMPVLHMSEVTDVDTTATDKEDSTIQDSAVKEGNRLLKPAQARKCQQTLASLLQPASESEEESSRVSRRKGRKEPPSKTTRTRRKVASPSDEKEASIEKTAAPARRSSGRQNAGSRMKSLLSLEKRTSASGDFEESTLSQEANDKRDAPKDDAATEEPQGKAGRSRTRRGLKGKAVAEVPPLPPNDDLASANQPKVVSSSSEDKGENEEPSVKPSENDSEGEAENGEGTHDNKDEECPSNRGLLVDQEGGNAEDKGKVGRSRTRRGLKGKAVAEVPPLPPKDDLASASQPKVVSNSSEDKGENEEPSVKPSGIDSEGEAENGEGTHDNKDEECPPNGGLLVDQEGGNAEDVMSTASLTPSLVDGDNNCTSGTIDTCFSEPFPTFSEVMAECQAYIEKTEGQHEEKEAAEAQEETVADLADESKAKAIAPATSEPEHVAEEQPRASRSKDRKEGVDHEKAKRTRSGGGVAYNTAQGHSKRCTRRAAYRNWKTVPRVAVTNIVEDTEQSEGEPDADRLSAQETESIDGTPSDTSESLTPRGKAVPRPRSSKAPRSKDPKEGVASRKRKGPEAAEELLSTRRKTTRRGAQERPPTGTELLAEDSPGDIEQPEALQSPQQSNKPRHGRPPRGTVGRKTAPKVVDTKIVEDTEQSEGEPDADRLSAQETESIEGTPLETSSSLTPSQETAVPHPRYGARGTRQLLQQDAKRVDEAASKDESGTDHLSAQDTESINGTPSETPEKLTASEGNVVPSLSKASRRSAKTAKQSLQQDVEEEDKTALDGPVAGNSEEQLQGITTCKLGELGVAEMLPYRPKMSKSCRLQKLQKTPRRTVAQRPNLALQQLVPLEVSVKTEPPSPGTSRRSSTKTAQVQLEETEHLDNNDSAEVSSKPKRRVTELKQEHISEAEASSSGSTTRRQPFKMPALAPVTRKRDARRTGKKEDPPPTSVMPVLKIMEETSPQCSLRRIDRKRHVASMSFGVPRHESDDEASSNEEETLEEVTVKLGPKSRQKAPVKEVAVKQEVVEEAPVKRGKRKADAPEVKPEVPRKARSRRDEQADSSLAPKKAVKVKPKVLFTGIDSTSTEEVVRDLGGTIATNVSTCTHLVTDKFRRTVKALCCIGKGTPIVDVAWIKKCQEAGAFVDHMPHMLLDKKAEKTLRFSLRDTLAKASAGGVLRGWSVHATPRVLPSPSDMKEIVMCAGGKYLDNLPARSSTSTTVVVSCKEDLKACARARNNGVPVVAAEFVLSGLLQHKLDIEAHRLE